MASNKSIHARFIKKTASSLGFDYCGISKAEALESERSRLENWLSRENHGKMGYMEDHFEKRIDPTRLVEGSRSVISLLYNYYPEKELPAKNNFKIARYAYGEDYHHVIRKKLLEFLDLIRSEIGEVNGRVFVDSAPVMERQWAARSGLGWIGKNTLLINKDRGSYFFISELVIDLDLEYDHPIKDYCGTCTRCMDACPTGALSPYQMDASRCISYLTIELKEQIPEEFKGKTSDWIFGCDICQEVCPWNRFSQAHREPAFEFNAQLQDMNKTKWSNLEKNTFDQLFSKSAVKRTKFEGMKRNIRFQGKIG